MPFGAVKILLQLIIRLEEVGPNAYLCKEII